MGRFGGQESRASEASRKGVEEVGKTGGSWPRQLVAAPTLCLSRGQGCFCKRQGLYFLHRRLAVGCQPWTANGQSTTLKAVDNRRQIRAFWSVWQQTALKRCAQCTRGTWVGAHATHGVVPAPSTRPHGPAGLRGAPPPPHVVAWAPCHRLHHFRCAFFVTASVVATVYESPGCTGRDRPLLTTDFVSGRHDDGWDACGETYSDGSNMAYQSSLRTWLRSFKVGPGFHVNTSNRCHDGYFYNNKRNMHRFAPCAAHWPGAV